MSKPTKETLQLWRKVLVAARRYSQMSNANAAESTDSRVERLALAELDLERAIIAWAIQAAEPA